MYTILIVDDCPAEIECILYLIRRYALPLEAATASDGQTAYALLRRRHFDILFTDIKMPLMDGISLSGKAKELYPDLRVILFSGYNDFIDAKNAISIGVTEYLMKPVDPEEFNRTLQTTIDTIASARARSRDALFVRRHMLYLALSRDAETPPPAQERAFVEPYGLMLMLKFDTDFFSGEGENFESRLGRFLSSPCDFISLYPEQGLILLRRLLTEPDAQGTDALAERAKRFVREAYGRECVAACERIDGAGDFLPAYQRLEARTERSLSAPPESASPELPMEQMLESIRQGDILLFRDLFDGFLSRFSGANAPSNLYTKFCVTQLITELHRQKGDSFRESELVERVFACADVETLRSLVYDALRTAEANADMLSNQKVEAIKRYIYQHFCEDISLDALASAFYFSPNYLCRLFKQETGCSPGKFLHDYRMKKAQELLESSQMKVSHVSHAVGYKSTSYFCQRFRDRFGVSPELYRQNALRLQNARGQEGKNEP